MLILRAEAHDRFDPAAVVPGAVKQNDLACAWEMIGITLKIPLRLFGIGRFFKSDHAGAPRVEMFGDAFDGTAFAGGITPFKDHQQFEPFHLNVILQFQELDLQGSKLLFIFEDLFFNPDRDFFAFFNATFFFSALFFINLAAIGMNIFVKFFTVIYI